MAAPDSLCPGDAGRFQSGGGGMRPAALSEDRGMAVASGSMFAGVAADDDFQWTSTPCHSVLIEQVHYEHLETSCQEG